MSENLPAKTVHSEATRSDCKIDVLKALVMRLRHNMSYTDIGKHYGVSKQAAHHALQPYLSLMLTPEEMEDYRRTEVQLLTGASMLLLSDIVDPEKRQKATQGNSAYTWDKIQNHLRLIQGLSTSNVAVHVDISVKLEELEAQRKALTGED